MNSKDLVVGQQVRVVVEAPLLRYTVGKRCGWAFIGTEKGMSNFSTMMGGVSSTRIGDVVRATLVGQVKTVGKRGALYLRAHTITPYFASIMAKHIISVELLRDQSSVLDKEEES